MGSGNNISLPIMWLFLGGMHYSDQGLQYLDIFERLVKVQPLDVQTPEDISLLLSLMEKMHALPRYLPEVIVRAVCLHVMYACRQDERCTQKVLVAA